MDLNLLRFFATVVEQGSFTAAAARLALPKSTVSRGVQELETQLGVQLLHRTTRRVSPSTAGEHLFQELAPLLQRLEGTLAALPELGGAPAGTLRVTASVDFGMAVLAPLASRFLAAHPGVHLDLHLTGAYVDLVAEGFDLAVRISSGRLLDGSLKGRRVAKVVQGLFASPEYLGGRALPTQPMELAALDFVAFKGLSELQLLRDSERVAVPVHSRLDSDDMTFTLAAIRAGAGIGLVPVFLAERDVSEGRLVPVLSEWSQQSGEVWLLWPSQPRVPRKVAAFAEFIVAELSRW